MKMTNRDRRAITLGLAVLAPALLYVRGVKPYLAALGEARERLAVERSTLTRERALLALEPRSAQLEAAVDSVLRLQRQHLLETEDDGVAAADLATYLAQVAERSNVWLQEADQRATTAVAPGVRAIAVEIRAESDFAGLLTFLRALEQGAKLVRVTELGIAPAAAANDTTSSAPRALALQATVIGYALGDRASGAAPAAPRAHPAPRGSNDVHGEPVAIPALRQRASMAPGGEL